MPCNTITTVTLEIKNANLEWLKKAVISIVGDYSIRVYPKRLTWYGGSYNKETGEMIVQNKAQGEKIKRAYSAEIVKAQAKRFGWQVKDQGNFKYQIIKR